MAATYTEKSFKDMGVGDPLLDLLPIDKQNEMHNSMVSVVTLLCFVETGTIWKVVCSLSIESESIPISVCSFFLENEPLKEVLISAVFLNIPLGVYEPDRDLKG